MQLIIFLMFLYTFHFKKYAFDYGFNAVLCLIQKVKESFFNIEMLPFHGTVGHNWILWKQIFTIFGSIHQYSNFINSLNFLLVIIFTSQILVFTLN